MAMQQRGAPQMHARMHAQQKIASFADKHSAFLLLDVAAHEWKGVCNCLGTATGAAAATASAAAAAAAAAAAIVAAAVDDNNNNDDDDDDYELHATSPYAKL